MDTKKLQKAVGLIVLAMARMQMQKFDPGQKRDEGGQWADEGKGEGGGQKRKENSIRSGTSEEVKNFQLFNEDNEGDEITVLEHGGKIAAYVQHTGGDIYFIESEQPGGGKALVEKLKSEQSYLTAHAVEETAKGFWEKMDFHFAYDDGFGGETWTWEE